jgi:rubrerythrin
MPLLGGFVMSALISGRDLIEIAIEAERRGVTFYGCLAESMPSAKARDLFARMEQEEKEHLRELQGLLGEADRYHPAEPYPDAYYGYLRALLEDWALPGEEACAQMARDMQDEARACPLASTFERQVILLLHEMRRFVPEDKHGTVQRLLEGEYEHVRHLHALEQEGQP